MHLVAKITRSLVNVLVAENKGFAGKLARSMVNAFSQ
jgi:hypothetical protein